MTDILNDLTIILSSITLAVLGFVLFRLLRSNQ